MKSQDELIELANSLSNKEIVTLFNCFASRCQIFYGSLGNRLITSEFCMASLNGCTIQIDGDLSELDCLSHDKWIADAIAILTEGGD